MSKDKFIAGKHDDCNHEGRRSTQRRLDASQSEIDCWRAGFDLEMILPYVNHLKSVVNEGLRIRRRAEVLGTHEQGEPELCFPGEIGGHFQTNQEVTVFEASSEENRLGDIRRELELIAYGAKFDGNGNEL
jgi:hypothetical protein